MDRRHQQRADDERVQQDAEADQERVSALSSISGSTASAPKVAASTSPALVMTPPVTDSARSTPFLVPWTAASSRARVISKMLSSIPKRDQEDEPDRRDVLDPPSS